MAGDAAMTSQSEKILPESFGGPFEIRAESLPFVLSLMDKSGIIVLDDMHKARGGLISGYRAVAIKEVKNSNASTNVCLSTCQYP